MAAITMTAAEMAAMVAEAVRVALATMKKEEQEGVRGEGEEGGRGKGSGSGRRLLDLKSFSNIASFNGQEGEWAEWSFGFGVTLSASHAGLGKLAKEVVKMPEEMAYPELAMHDFKFQDGADMHWDYEKMSKEFYEVLAVKCQGEALKVVRGIEDQDGFVAWHRLHARFNPKTMARSMMKMVRAITPGHVKDIKDLEKEVASWEEAVRDLAKDYNEEISDKMRMAIFTAMCNTSLQDIIYQKVDTLTTYASLKESILAIVRNRIIMGHGGAVKMTVNEVEEQEEEEEAWYEIDYVTPATQCHKCQGYGHLANVCPSKGKGKMSNFGGYSKGKGGTQTKGLSKGEAPFKGYTKGTFKGQSKGFGFGGKGYQGSCWTCGQTGHKAAECPKGTAQINEVEEVAEVGGVWTIGSIEPMKIKTKVFDIGTRNRFSCFDMDEDDTNLEFPMLPSPNTATSSMSERARLKACAFSHASNSALKNNKKSQATQAGGKKGQSHATRAGGQKNIQSHATQAGGHVSVWDGRRTGSGSVSSLPSRASWRDPAVSVASVTVTPIEKTDNEQKINFGKPQVVVVGSTVENTDNEQKINSGRSQVVVVGSTVENTDNEQKINFKKEHDKTNLRMKEGRGLGQLSRPLSQRMKERRGLGQLSRPLSQAYKERGPGRLADPCSYLSERGPGRLADPCSILIGCLSSALMPSGGDGRIGGNGDLLSALMPSGGDGRIGGNGGLHSALKPSGGDKNGTYIGGLSALEPSGGDGSTIFIGEIGTALSSCITIDSGAGVSVWPSHWRCPGKAVKEGPKTRLEAANGTPIKQYGRKRIPFEVNETRRCGEMDFIVTDVTKPLAAVSAIVDAGNRVVFCKEGSFIENMKTGEKISLKCERGTYTMDVGIKHLEIDAVATAEKSTSDFIGQA
jgi:hypothetical protein